MKTVKIDFFHVEHEYIIFSLSFTTMEWEDLLQFIENGMQWHYHSKWLEGIKEGIESVKSGYFDSDKFILKASVL